MNIDVPKSLLEFAEKSPCPVYAVGGFVRNRLLNLPLSDIDICGPHPVEEVASKFAKFVTVNKALGTAQISYKDEKYEYTRFRHETYADSGAHSPLSVGFDTDLHADAMRRDFTCNSVYYDLKNKTLVDPLGGLSDIKNKILRSHDPMRIFAADGLRLMRLCRFAAQLGFEIDPSTYSAAALNEKKLQDIAAERKRDELDKILIADLCYGKADAHFKGLCFLHSLGLFAYILPCLTEMEIKQNPKYHIHNVLLHTLMAVRHAPPEVRLAALMHDTGKPASLMRDGNMYDHARISAELVKKELGQEGLKYPTRVVDETVRLVSLHMYDSARNTSDGKMRVFVAENFDIIDKLNALAVADKSATGMPNHNAPRFLHFKQLLIQENAPLSIRELKIDGQDLRKLGIAGKNIGAALKELWRQCVLNPRLNTREWLLTHAK